MLLHEIHVHFSPLLMKVLMSVIISALMVRALSPISPRFSSKVGSGPMSDPFPVKNWLIHFRSQICEKCNRLCFIYYFRFRTSIVWETQ